MKFTLICNPENRRAEFFRQACERLGLPAPNMVAWETVLGEGTVPPEFASDAIRIESPGENFEVERLLIEKGGGPKRLTDDHGRIRQQVPWYAGWKAVLGELADRHSKTVFMNDPLEIAEMFDKPVAQVRLAGSGVPVPHILGEVASFTQLREQMESTGVRRVFLKPSHSSSASGIVALQIGSGDRILATTPAQIECDPEMGTVRIYNSLRLQTYNTTEDVATLIDALAAENLFAEQWFPKASMAALSICGFS